MTKSLKYLAESKTAGVSKTTYFKVDPRLIEFEEGFNGRIEGPDLDAYIQELKTAILGGATLPPLDVRVEDGRILAVDGHCRTRAYRELIEEGHDFKAVDARQFTGNEADRVAHMIGSSQGRALTVLERAHAYNRLIKMGWGHKEIAERVGKTTPHIYQTLKLVEVSPSAQKAIQDNKIAAHLVIDMVNKHGPDKATEMVYNAVNKAVQQGQKKVTAKTISVPSYPKEITYTVINAVQAVREVVSEEAIAYVNSPDELKGSIEVPAPLLARLIDAFEEIEKIQQKRIKKQQALEHEHE